MSLLCQVFGGLGGTSADTTPVTSAPYTIFPAPVGGPWAGEAHGQGAVQEGGYEAFDFKNQGRCLASVQRGPKHYGHAGRCSHPTCIGPAHSG